MPNIPASSLFLSVDYLSELNPVQLQAVQTAEGPIMIIAGAGSGKTRVLTYRISYLIQHGIDPFHILSLTFTNKAAKEMKERIAKVVGKSETGNLWMGTFHSVFSRILRAEHEKLGFPQNFTIYDTDDAKSLLRTIIGEMNLDDKIYKPNVIYNRISNAKNALINSAAYKKHPDLITDDKIANRPKMAEIYEKYTIRCFKAGAMDFDDLLLKTYELFAKYPDILYKYQQRFRFVMVDEFQDTNFAQYAIIRQLSAMHQNICVVGDDAQSIYAFRGANIQNILNFEKDYPELKTFKLEQNYRSTSNIVQAANSIIAKNKYQLDKNVWTDNPEGGKIKIVKTQTDNEEGVFVAQNIFEAKMNLKYANRDFAVLYRTNAQSRSIEEALRRLSIPYRIYGSVSFYQRKEIKDLLFYFRVVINPQDETGIKRIINYPARGIGKTSIDRLTVAADENDTTIWNILENMRHLETGISSGAVKKLEEFLFMIRGFQAAMAQKSAFEVASLIATQSGLLKELYSDRTPEGLSRYENIQELLNGIKEFTDKNAGIEGGNTLPKFMEDIALLTDADREDDDPNKVSLMTIHASKGLEFKHVFITGMEENLFPSQLSITSREELEEERRLFYVALTRAMNQVYLCYAQTRYKWGNLIYTQASRFLEEIDPSFIDTSGVKQTASSFQSQTFTSNTINTGLNTSQYTNPRSGLKKVAQLNKAPDPNFQADAVDAFATGQTVVHQRFGTGVIQAIEGSNQNKMATIVFDVAGEKKLLLKFAKLKIQN